MKTRIRSIIAACLLGLAIPVLAGEMETDELIVNRTATFYGKATFESRPQGAPLPSGDMVLGYNFNAEVGGTNDISGNNRTATAYLAAWDPDGMVQGCYRFAGDGNYIELPSGAISGIGAGSACFWVLVNDASDNQFLNGVSQAEDVGVQFRTGAGDKIGMILGSYYNGVYVGFSDDTLTPGVWTFLAFTWNGSSAQIYRDGRLVESVTDPRCSIPVNTVPFRLGRDTRSNYDGQALRGKLDEVRVYGRSLTSQEVYNAYLNYTYVADPDAGNIYAEKVITATRGVVQTDTLSTNTFMGKVMIGADREPTQALDVQGNVAVSGNGNFGLVKTPAVRAKDVAGLGLGDKDGAGLFVADGGKVGVGTTTPGEDLHVTGKGRFDQGISHVGRLGDLSMGTFQKEQ